MPKDSNKRIPRRLQTKNSKLKYGKRSIMGPMSPPLSPPRLRRLGVRQAGEDRFFPLSKESDSEGKGKKTHGSEVGEKVVRKRHESSSAPLTPLGRTSVLKCPVCTKKFLSFYGHDVHLDLHDSAAIKCWPCNLRFNSNKSLLQHQRLRHNKKKEEDGSCVRGFHNLTFVDFSCDKFPAVCQRFCDTRRIQTATIIHDYSCSQCQKSFPMQSALDLHTSQYHYFPSKFICTLCHHDYHTKAKLEEHKLNYPFSSKRQLADSKRKFLRALSLMPQCAGQSMLRHKHPPAINNGYYDKLKSIPTVTKVVYELSEVRSDDEDASDSSQS